MGIFGGTKSNNSKRFQSGLMDGEEIEATYRLVIDEICFTNKRIIFYDKTAFSTKKGKVSIPYKSISSYMIEDDGIFDRDIEVKILTNSGEFNLKFSKGEDLHEVEKLLTCYICG